MCSDVGLASDDTAQTAADGAEQVEGTLVLLVQGQWWTVQEAGISTGAGDVRTVYCADSCARPRLRPETTAWRCCRTLASARRTLRRSTPDPAPSPARSHRNSQRHSRNMRRSHTKISQNHRSFSVRLRQYQMRSPSAIRKFSYLGARLCAGREGAQALLPRAAGEGWGSGWR